MNDVLDRTVSWPSESEPTVPDRVAVPLTGDPVEAFWDRHLRRLRQLVERLEGERSQAQVVLSDATEALQAYRRSKQG